MYRPSIISKNPSNNQSISTLLLIGLLVIVSLSFGLTSTVFDTTSTQARLPNQSGQYNQFDNDMDKISDLDFSTQPEIGKELRSTIAATMSGFNAGFRENPNLTGGVQYLLSSWQMDIQFSQSSVQLRIPNYGPSTESNEIPPSDQEIGVDPDVNLSDIPQGNKLIEDMSKPMTPKLLGYTVAILEFVGSNPVDPIAQSPSASYFNYFYGSDLDKWVSNAQSYNKLVYKELYDNIDLVYSLKEGQLKYDFYVFPGGNYEDIQLRWDGSVSLQQSSDGLQISISTPFGEQSLVDSNPINFLGTNRDEKVLGSFRVIDEGTYGFSMEDYDRSRVLIIDPILEFSTFLGGSGNEFGYSLAIDGSGNVYITGYTDATDFPTTPGAYDETNNGVGLNAYDVFVSKLAANGSTLLYSTYLGGSGSDKGQSLVVDSTGNVYITGSTLSINFPTTPGAYDETFNGGNDAFVSKLSVDGSALLYSTFLGGLREDYAYSLAIDSNRNVYITGFTTSTDFPTTSGAYTETYNGGTYDVFVARLSADGSTLIFSSYLGGSGSDFAYSLAVDGSGNVYITGKTDSTNFPTTSGAYDETYNGGGDDGFVVRLAADGSALPFSTFLGGSGRDWGYSLAIDSSGNVYVTGSTVSTDFPTTAGAYDEAIGAYYDGFVSKLNTDLSVLLASTFLGASDEDNGYSLTIDKDDNVYITGRTLSTDFPTTPNAYDATHNGKTDVFVAKLTSDISTLLFSTFLGGSRFDYGNALAVDDSGNIYIIGITSNDSINFPTTEGAFHETQNGGNNVFVTKISLKPGSPLNIQSFSQTNVDGSFVFLVWDKPHDDVSTISSYNVYRGTTSGSYSYMGSSFGPLAYFNDTSVIANQAYYYVVTALNQIGEGSFSAEYYVTLQPTMPITETETLIITETESATITETETATITETKTSTITDTDQLNQTTTEKTYFPILAVVMLILILPIFQRRFTKN